MSASASRSEAGPPLGVDADQELLGVEPEPDGLEAAPLSRPGSSCPRSLPQV